MHTEQDSDEDVMGCVEVLLSTFTGERIEAPDYGIDDQAFRENSADVGHIASKISLWEPRADIEIEPERIQDLVQTVRLRYRGRVDG